MAIVLGDYARLGINKAMIRKVVSMGTEYGLDECRPGLMGAGVDEKPSH